MAVGVGCPGSLSSAGDGRGEGVDLLEQLRWRLIEIERVLGNHDVADRVGDGAWFRAVGVDQAERAEMAGQRGLAEPGSPFVRVTEDAVGLR